MEDTESQRGHFYFGEESGWWETARSAACQMKCVRRPHSEPLVGPTGNVINQSEVWNQAGDYVLSGWAAVIIFQRCEVLSRGIRSPSVSVSQCLSVWHVYQLVGVSLKPGSVDHPWALLQINKVIIMITCEFLFVPQREF